MESTQWQRGIILKNTLQGGLQQHILDEQVGRIKGIWKAEFPVGTLLKYTIKKTYANSVIFEQCVIDDMPLALAKADLIFLHHLLELCYYFIPIGSSTQGIFNLLEFTYNQSIEDKSITYKKILVFKLLHMIGVCPEMSARDEIYIAKFISYSVDRLHEQFIDLASESMLDRWLLACIAQHPYYEQLNTINFLRSHR